MISVFQSIINAFMAFSFLSLATFGITLIFKTSSTTNFAQGMLGIVGAYITSSLINPSGIDEISGLPIETVNSAFQLILPILAGVAVSFIFGFLIEVVIFRNAKYTNAATKQIITMGLVIIITGFVPLAFNGLIRRQSFPFTNQSIPFFGLNNLPVHNIITLILSLVIIGGLFITLKYTKWGLAVRSVASNERVSGLMGVNTGM
ncbi:MAG: branched-chain amino acid ABC transporter permease, partial [Acholeplasmatales bacterium]|nr:branched-chain amino acid ABC transporter permease [Acholeplasmatales bacterium]